MTMEKTFKRKHKTSLMLGHEMTSRSSDYLQGKRTHGDNLLTDLDAGDAAYATNSGRASKTRTSLISVVCFIVTTTVTS